MRLLPDSSILKGEMIQVGNYSTRIMVQIVTLGLCLRVSEGEINLYRPAGSRTCLVRLRAVTGLQGFDFS